MFTGRLFTRSVHIQGKEEFSLQVWPLSTTSAICPKVMHGKHAVMIAVKYQINNIHVIHEVHMNQRVIFNSYSCYQLLMAYIKRQFVHDLW